MSDDAQIPQKMTMAYVIALLLIAVLAIGSHLVLNQAIEQQRDTATVINVAGRQRMLSQRIAFLADDLERQGDLAQADFTKAVDLMERSHRALINGNDLGVSNSPSSSIQALYYDGPNALDQLVSTYISSARSMLSAKDLDERLAVAEQIRFQALGVLLPTLDKVVFQYEQEANERIGSLRAVQNGVLAILILTLICEAFFIFRPLVNRVKAYAARLHALATSDPLTGLPNRRQFNDMLSREILVARRTRESLSLLAIDLDFFKKVNDLYGHDIGDQVLKRFAEIAQLSIRRTDLIARVGGEEFFVVLPRTNAGIAERLAEKIRTVIETDEFESLPKVTVSIGLTELTEDDKNLSDLTIRADRALYAAKRSGRNRVSVELAPEAD